MNTSKLPIEGKVLSSVEKLEESIIFTVKGGETYRMYHKEDCCEHVYIEDINGDLNDLIECRINLAEEIDNIELSDECKKMENNAESFTWTFYKFSTIKGDVTIRWFGESNGYYSESVDFELIKS